MAQFLQIVRRDPGTSDTIVERVVNLDWVAKIVPQDWMGTIGQRHCCMVTYHDGTEEAWTVSHRQIMEALTRLGPVATITYDIEVVEKLRPINERHS